MTPQNLHQEQPVVMAGKPLADASAAMILLHGRGATAEDILSLATEVDHSGFAYLAPQAAMHTWYPQRFLMPRSANEPWLSSALSKIEGLLQQIAEAGVAAERTILLGFSQGACLALEYAARNPQRYGGVVALSGGLIGADDELKGYSGSLADTPIFLGCSDVDFHIPKERVETSAAILGEIGGKVTIRLYPGMGHMVNQDELDFAHKMMTEVIDNSA